MALARAHGVADEQIVLDPGPDFAKTPPQTVAVLRDIERLRALGRPLLLAVSRKYFLGAITGRPPAERLAGTLAAAAWAVDAGAAILRVHDVAGRARLRWPSKAVLEGRAEVPRLRCGRRGAEVDPGPTGSLTSLTGSPAAAHNAAGLPTDTMSEEDLMPVLHRAALEASPLADLHAIASELGIDGFRRLRKAELVDRILARDSGGEAAAPRGERGDRRRRGTTWRPRARSRARPRSWTRRPRRRRRAAPRAGASTRGGRGAVGPRRAPIATGATAAMTSRLSRPRGPTRRSRASSSCSATARASCASRRPSRPTTTSTSPPPRCAAASWSPATASSGPVREPRRSERYPSLVRVDTINGAPADEVAEGTHFDELPCAYPTERLALGSDDATLKAIEWLTPIGTRLARGDHRRGARGQDRDAARLAGALNGVEGLEAQRRARRRASGGGRRVEARRIAGPRGRAVAGRRVRRRRPRPWSARSTPPSGSPRAAATPSCSSTRSTRSRRTSPAARWPRRATSSTAAR